MRRFSRLGLMEARRGPMHFDSIRRLFLLETLDKQST